MRRYQRCIQGGEKPQIIFELFFMLAAATAACFSLVSLTSCEKDNGNENGNEPGNGGESAVISIEKQWIGSITQEGLEVKQCFDINYGVEGGVLIGQYTEGYASMLPDGADPDKSYIAMVMGPDEFVSDTPDADKTSGTVTYKTDMDGTAETEVKLEYANLTENSVDITYNDPNSGSAIKVSCTVAPEGTKVYTYADLM